MSSCARPAFLRTLSAAILFIASAGPLRAADSPKGPGNVDSRLNPFVTLAVAMAEERLSSQACAAVVLDFTDVRTGRLLSETLAATIFVCRSRFVAVLTRDKGLAANLLVHETLHSLGLGENPPSSEEISHRIEARCGL